jgi:uncharacterized membrane protein YfcA
VDYLIEQIFVMIVIGTAAGIVGAMVGVGGGIIISPVLTFMGLNPAQISSTSLISVSSTSLSSTIAYSRQGKIKYRLGIRMASFAIPGAAIGAILSSIVPLEQFKMYFAIILFLTGIYLWLRNNIGRKGDIKGYTSTNNKRTGNLILSAGCLGAGLVSSLFGIGGGIIFVPLMLVVLNLTMSTAAATSQLSLLITSIVGNVVHISLGHPEYLPAIFLSIGSVIGAQIGANLSRYVSNTLLVRLLSISLIVVSGKLLFDSISSEYFR